MSSRAEGRLRGAVLALAFARDAAGAAWRLVARAAVPVAVRRLALDFDVDFELELDFDLNLDFDLDLDLVLVLVLAGAFVPAAGLRLGVACFALALFADADGLLAVELPDVAAFVFALGFDVAFDLAFDFGLEVFAFAFDLPAFDAVGFPFLAGFDPPVGADDVPCDDDAADAEDPAAVAVSEDGAARRGIRENGTNHADTDDVTTGEASQAARSTARGIRISVGRAEGT